MILVGSLTGQDNTVTLADIAMWQKKVRGLGFNDWLAEQSQEEQERIKKWIADDLLNGGKIFGTSIVKTVPLTEWKAAFEGRNEIANQGKFVLKIE